MHEVDWLPHVALKADINSVRFVYAYSPFVVVAVSQILILIGHVGQL